MEEQVEGRQFCSHVRDKSGEKYTIFNVEFGDKILKLVAFLALANSDEDCVGELVFYFCKSAYPVRNPFRCVKF